MKTELNKVVQGNIEALDQAILLLDQLADEQYSSIVEPYVSSSIGQHVRHVVDIYLAFFKGLESKRINYDKRSRGSELEFNRKLAISTCRLMKERFDRLLSENGENTHVVATTLRKLTEEGELECLVVISESQLNHTCKSRITSNILRELLFVCSHAVHHFALIKIIARILNVEVDKAFGIAPATASFLRESQETTIMD